MNGICIQLFQNTDVTVLNVCLNDILKSWEIAYISEMCFFAIQHLNRTFSQGSEHDLLESFMNVNGVFNIWTLLCFMLHRPLFPNVYYSLILNKLLCVLTLINWMDSIFRFPRMMTLPISIKGFYNPLSIKIKGDNGVRQHTEVTILI